MTASFGAPSPLPGQPGFRASPSEAMARETAEMEVRLAQLKESLATEAEVREAAGPRIGGARWRSARANRGSVRAYAKDVKRRQRHQMQERPPHSAFSKQGLKTSGSGSSDDGCPDDLDHGVKPQAGAGARAAAALRERDEQQRYRRQQKNQGDRWDEAQPGGEWALSNKVNRRRQLPPSSDKGVARYVTKQVGQWSVSDTLEWLDSLGLGQYLGMFQQNEISGPILLEVGLDDLDYMNVKILAHRKRILKAIEELRCGNKGDSNMANVPPPAPAPPDGEEGARGGCEGAADGRKLPSNAVQGVIAERNAAGSNDEQNAAANRKVKRQHWSSVEPLSDRHVNDSDETGQSTTTLANGEYDEEAAHTSFADAVAAWRCCQQDIPEKSLPSSSKYNQPNPPEYAPVAGHLKRNNNAAAPERCLITRSRETQQNPTERGVGLLGLNSVGGMVGCWVNPFASPRPGTNSRSEDHRERTETNQEESCGSELMSPPHRAHAAPTKSTTVGDEGIKCLLPVSRPLGEDAPPLDEEAEHSAFRKAVADWNHGRRKSAHAKSNERNENGDGIIELKTPAAGVDPGDFVTVDTPRKAAELLAERLREQMDADHRVQARKMEEQKRRLLRGLDKDDSAKSCRDDARIAFVTVIDVGATANVGEEVDRGRSVDTISERGGLFEDVARDVWDDDAVRSTLREDRRAVGTRKTERGGHEHGGGHSASRNDDRSKDRSDESSSTLSPRRSSRDSGDFALGDAEWQKQQRNASDNRCALKIECIESVLGGDLSVELGESLGYVVEEDSSRNSGDDEH